MIKLETAPLEAEWLRVLEQVRAVFPRACIAGGALRDRILGAPIKDVDIFIPVSVTHQSELDAVYEKIWDIFDDNQIIEAACSHYATTPVEEKERDIYSVFKLQLADWQYDLIVCAERAANAALFDINICQATYTDGAVYVSDAFMEAQQSRTVRIMNINRTDRNKQRLFRIKEKYPDWEYPDLQKEVSLCEILESTLLP